MGMGDLPVLHGNPRPRSETRRPVRIAPRGYRTSGTEKRRSLSSFTQTDIASLDACVASAVDILLSSLDASPTSSFDYTSTASELNSAASGLTSLGITVSSLLSDPASFTGAEPHSGPYVSDIVASYSAYTATHTGSGGSSFSFDTSAFLATATTSQGLQLFTGTTLERYVDNVSQAP
ncbi:hypothetical protein CLCR_03716 [Cladophialophora carrionii]|uniref:Uncharacterized protein n=1 Tax=Cladophialophora carrionii TaxID=86049 RepID=A0A1C1CH18_9EURO|nr:hypothetical protein CLCR_03716 [Cladophialophora carrionii]